MPAVYAHYVFGKKVYQRLPEEIRQMIRENREAYWIGLHGPDLLFYYKPWKKNRINSFGNQMHRESAAPFFEKGRKVYQRRPSYVLLSYLTGFICHFTLDSECHPYIGEYMEAHGVSHSAIETDLDMTLMRKDGKDPVRHNCTRHLVRDLDTEEAIASVFDGITPEEIDQCLLGFSKTIRLFQCPGKAKQVFLDTALQLARQSESIRDLAMTGVPDLRCTESREFLQERLQHSVDQAVKLICEYWEKIDTDESLSARFDRDFS